MRSFVGTRISYSSLLACRQGGRLIMAGQPIDETSSRDNESQAVQSAAVKPPRVWTVFAAVGLALVLAILLQVIFVIVLAIVEAGRGVKPEELGDAIADRLTSPFVLISLIATGQLAFGLAGFLAALWSPEPFRERLAWRKASPSWLVFPLAMMGSLLPLAIGLAAAESLATVIPPDETFKRFFEVVTIGPAIVFVLFIGVAPGLFEEVLFRGYVQPRLVKRWGIVKGIVVTTILFGLAHVMPHAIAAALPLGFWFGYIAWRSRSILPAVFCHFFVNSGLNAWRMIVKFSEVPEIAQNSVHACSLAAGVVCFVVCCLPAFWGERRNAKS